MRCRNECPTTERTGPSVGSKAAAISMIVYFGDGIRKAAYYYRQKQFKIDFKTKQIMKSEIYHRIVFLLVGSMTNLPVDSLIHNSNKTNAGRLFISYILFSSCTLFQRSSDKLRVHQIPEVLHLTVLCWLTCMMTSSPQEHFVIIRFSNRAIYVIRTKRLNSVITFLRRNFSVTTLDIQRHLLVVNEQM